MANEYCSLPEIKAWLGITDTQHDTVLTGLIERVARAIDRRCRRHFYKQGDPTPEVRVFSACDPKLVDIDDLVSVTSFKSDEDGDRTYETTWAAADYELD